MSAETWLQGGTLLVGLLGGGMGFAAFRTAKPQAKKLSADTAAVIATTAGKWVMDADERMEEMQAVLTKLAKAQRAQDELIQVHARWDRQVLAALEAAKIDHLPPPPPMYLPQTG